MGFQTLEIKWANHKSNMTSELQELYLSEALLDVTIACGEFSLKAHKTVLSASSTFFRKLFLDNPCNHPILIMTDIDFDDLKTIVEFMYQGEVHISQQKLTRFLKTAGRLKIKGLSSIEDVNVNPSEQPQIDVDSHYTSSSWEHASNQPQVQDIIQVENVQNSPKKLTDCTQSSTSKEKPSVKVERELQSTVNDDCMYWQSDCFDQASSSSVLSVCTVPASPPVPAIPSVPHQQSTPSVSHQPNPSISHQPISSVSQATSSVSHQLSILKSVSHQQTATSSVSHQLPNLSDPDQLSNPSVSHQIGVPLSSESFMYSESHTDSSTQAQVQEEGTGRDVIPVNLYQSQDQSSISFPSSTKPSFDVVEPLNSQSSSQGGETDFTSFLEEKLEIINISKASTRNADRNLGSSPYQCDTCGKKFVRRDTLEKHRLHDPLNKFVCAVCGYRFRHKANLLKHHRTHTKEKPYKCNVCQKRFSQQSNLYAHHRIHTGERPYQCAVCHKSFTLNSTLRDHERLHTGERPYKCHVCGLQFTKYTNLIQHRGVHCR